MPNNLQRFIVSNRQKNYEDFKLERNDLKVKFSQIDYGTTFNMK